MKISTSALPRYFVLLTYWLRISFALLVLSLLITSATSTARAEVIRQFEADIKLLPDCSLDVIENIKMDFENSPRHGIFRIIPIQYSRYNNDYTLAFKLLDVTDENNNRLPYETSRLGTDFHIKIGDPYLLIKGNHTYCLHYVVKRAINFFGDRAELYWNGTGNDWPFSIESALVRFYPPKNISTSEIRTMSFVGKNASTTTGTASINDKYIEYSAKNLEPGSGITIVAQLPPGSFKKPTLIQEIIWFLQDWYGLVLSPILTLLCLAPILIKRTQDPDHTAIAVEWNPPKNLSPAEVGTLVDESCDMQDIVSTLVDLAARGYLQIKEIKAPSFLFFSEKDYQFTQIPSGQNDNSLLPHEKEFLNALFKNGSSTKLSDLREKFYIHLPYIRQAIYQSLTDKQLFYANPETVRWRWRTGAIILGSLAALVLAWTTFSSHTSFGFGLLISAMMVLASAEYMPARTNSGWQQRAECLGFQRFVRLAEKDRIAVLAKEDPTIFGRLLPFAMVLGAADQWAEAFRGLITEPPSWYIPYGYGNADYSFSSSRFVNELGNGMNTISQTFASVPANTTSSAGSGGSGFSGGSSGGGFGGGGGGSW